MAIKKIQKKISKTETGLEKKLEQGAKKIKKLSNQFMEKVEIVKKKYEKMDDSTKKKIMASIVGTAVVLAGAGAISKSRRNHK